MPRFNQKLRAKMRDRAALPMLQWDFPHVPESSCTWRVAVVDIDQRAGGCTFRVRFGMGDHSATGILGQHYPFQERAAPN